MAVSRQLAAQAPSRVPSPTPHWLRLVHAQLHKMDDDGGYGGQRDSGDMKLVRILLCLVNLLVQRR